jgi:hypothetical protein
MSFRIAKPAYRIDLNEVPPLFTGDQLLRITSKSRKDLKRIVERFAHYFHYETDGDFPPYYTDEAPWTAYLFTNKETESPRLWVGACVFCKRSFDDIEGEIEVLEWIWLHPYFRGKDILKEQWPTLRKNHGDFLVERPGPAMRNFLMKHNRDSKFFAAPPCFDEPKTCG